MNKVKKVIWIAIIVVLVAVIGLYFYNAKTANNQPKDVVKEVVEHPATIEAVEPVETTEPAPEPSVSEIPEVTE